MPELGTKHECTSCSTKFYDLGKDEPICPKCGLNQLAEEEEPVEEPAAEEPTEEPPAKKTDKAKPAEAPDEKETDDKGKSKKPGE